MINKNLIPVETLRQLLRHDPETGKLYWLERHNGACATDKARIIFNKRFAGEEAFTAKDGYGYFCGTVLGSSMKAHRVVWALHYGAWPKEHIDHINHNRSDNCIKNLREVLQEENQRNQRKSKANTSGVTGVYWDRWTSQWVVRFKINGVQCNLGRFDDFDAAVAVRKNAERQRGYHQNHGN
jgi:hypothetical protein